MALNWPDKDPQETLDYRLNWRARVPVGDKIISSSWSSPLGISKTNSTFTDYTTTLWLSGGSVESSYTFVNTVNTQAGRTMEQSVKIRVVEK